MEVGVSAPNVGERGGFWVAKGSERSAPNHWSERAAMSVWVEFWTRALTGRVVQHLGQRCVLLNVVVVALIDGDLSAVEGRRPEDMSPLWINLEELEFSGVGEAGYLDQDILLEIVGGVEGVQHRDDLPICFSFNC